MQSQIVKSEFKNPNFLKKIFSTLTHRLRSFLSTLAMFILINLLGSKGLGATSFPFCSLSLND